MADLILHHYWPSPFAHKTRMAMGLAGLAWTSVEIPRVPPKPLLLPLTAGYRRTPVLQVGADIYCDTHNIAQVLADAEPNADDRLFPGPSRGAALMLAEWVDQTLFPLAVRVVIAEALDTAPPDFVQDRGDLYFGPGWTPEGLRADAPGVILQLEAGLGCLESCLAGLGRCDTRALSYGDVAAAFIAWFLRGRWSRGAELLRDHPHLCEVEAALEGLGQQPARAVSAEEALGNDERAAPQAPAGIQHRSDLAVGQSVGVRPYVQSSDPEVFGRLRALSTDRISIDHEHADVGHVAVHFPVAGYQIRPAD